MDIYRCNQLMSLDDARVVLQHEIERGGYVGIGSIDNIYSFRYPLRDLACLQAALADLKFVLLCNDRSARDRSARDRSARDRSARDRGDTPHRNPVMDAEYCAELGRWTCASIVLNRALPVTLMHAVDCDMLFAVFMGDGAVLALRGLPVTLAQAEALWGPTAIANRFVQLLQDEGQLDLFGILEDRDDNDDALAR